MGNMYDVAIWENLKYRNIGYGHILEETEDMLNVLLVKSEIKHPIQFNDFGIPLGLWGLKDYIEKYSMDIHIEMLGERLELRKQYKLFPALHHCNDSVLFNCRYNPFI